jgi:hypothetical protein
MTKAILGVVAGLIFGTAGALAYSHYLGDGKLLSDLQAQLDAANAQLAKASQDKQSLATETSSVSDQIDQLQNSNAALRKQLDDLKTNAPEATTAQAPAVNPMMLMGMMRGMMRGGIQGQQRMLLLQSRLHLTPDQATAIKAAMDADNKARRDLMQQMFRNNGKVDPQAAANANSLDRVLATTLTPDQQLAYKQVQSDEQASRADTMATMQVDQMMPLLQLTDAQKDQVYNSIYQAQLTSPDPTSLLGNPNAASVVMAQAKATQDAMTKVLTPDQMTLFQQQAQAAQQFGGPGGRRGQNGGGGQGGGGGNGAPAGATVTSAATPAPATDGSAAPAPTPAPATDGSAAPAPTPAPATDGSAAAAPASAAPAATTTSDSTTASASTNAAPAQ